MNMKICKRGWHDACGNVVRSQDAERNASKRIVGINAHSATLEMGYSITKDKQKP